jgi:hypothetical protein
MLKWFFCYFGSKRFSSSIFSRTSATRVRSYPSLTPQFFTATSNLGHQPIFQIFLLLDKWVFRLIWFLAARFSLNPNPIGLGFVWLCTRWVWMRHILEEMCFLIQSWAPVRNPSRLNESNRGLSMVRWGSISLDIMWIPRFLVRTSAVRVNCSMRTFKFFYNIFFECEYYIRYLGPYLTSFACLLTYITTI